MAISALLTLRFGHQQVTVACTDTAVSQTLVHHFKYCSGSGRTAVAHYQISQNEAGWQLQCDTQILLQCDQPTALFEPFLQDALEQLISPEVDHLIFHAAGVSLANSGVLLCGGTAVGKSTLSTQLTAVGFNYLSDEVVALPLTGAEMQGFARSIVLKPGSEFLWQGQPTSADLLTLPGGFTWVAPTFLRPDCVQATAVPQLILFPSFKPDSEFVVRPLSAAESTFNLMQQLVNARNLPDNGFTAVTQLAQKIPAFTVQHAGSTAVVAWLKSYLMTKT